MRESWRQILAQAAANINIDLAGTPPAVQNWGVRRQGPAPSAAGPASFPEGHDSLAWELNQLPGVAQQDPRSQPQMRQMQRPSGVNRTGFAYGRAPAPPRALNSEKGSSWHSFAAVLLSCVIMGLTAYPFLYHRQAIGGSAVASTSDKPVAASLPAATALQKETENAFAERAYQQLTVGDINGARTIYETLAQRGSQRGAFGLASTYDPSVLPPGWQADVRLAREWYEKAARLGSQKASQRLKALEHAN
jgi:hypothetical protein